MPRSVLLLINRDKPDAVAAADEVRVMNWKGWGTDEAWAVSEFEKETGTKVVHDYITSYPEVFAKLRTNPGYYDVVVLNAAFVGQAAPAEPVAEPAPAPAPDPAPAPAPPSGTTGGSGG